MKNYSKNITIHSTPEKVFAYMDSLGNTGMHMIKSNMPMMGGGLVLNITKVHEQKKQECLKF